MHDIVFNFVDDKYYFDTAELELWLTAALDKLEVKTSRLSYTFMGDDDLLVMNKQHLHHDFYTDIITFDLTDNNILEGDMYISLERVSDNASTIGVLLNDELRRVVVHGVLHLLGYNDKTESETHEMRKMEDSLIKAN